MQSGVTLWTLHELQEALGLPVEGENIAVTSVHTDSREIVKESLFIALPGEKQHGVEFADQAVKNGAAILLVPQKVEADIPQLVVTDTREAFLKLAKTARARMQGKIIAITGSAGKTTTKDLLVGALQAHGPVGSFNNHVGVPLTLVRMPQNSKYAVIEIGMNAPGEIEPLTKLAQPDIAVVLNVYPVHTHTFDGVEGVRKEKLSIAHGLSENGTLVVPEDLNLEGVNWHGNVEKFNPEGALPCPITHETPARVACANAAVAVLNILEENTPKTLNRLGQVPVPAGRGRVMDINGITLIDDSYNANPKSMDAALNVLLKQSAKRHIAILGDMFELGEEEITYHQNLSKWAEKLDNLTCVGNLMNHLYTKVKDVPHVNYIENVPSIDVHKLAATFQEGDVILVKGSKGMFWIHNFTQKLQKCLEERP